MTKPSKPSPDFPLFAHDSGKWAKKIQGKLHYFGRWDDPAAALSEYEQRAARPAKGRHEARTGLTVRDACNAFLHAKQSAVDRRELAPRSFLEYQRTCLRPASNLGRETIVETLTPADFAPMR